MGLIRDGGTSVSQPIQNIQPLVQNNGVQPLDAKSKRILMQGIVQATLQAPVLQMFCTSWEEWIHLVKKTVDEAVKLVEEKS